jgi:hypothetical protein
MVPSFYFIHIKTSTPWLVYIYVGWCYDILASKIFFAHSRLSVVLRIHNPLNQDLDPDLDPGFFSLIQNQIPVFDGPKLKTENCIIFICKPP